MTGGAKGADEVFAYRRKRNAFFCSDDGKEFFMSFLDKLKEFTRPYPDDEDDDYYDETPSAKAPEPVAAPQSATPRTPTYSSAYSEFSGRSAPTPPMRAAANDKVVNIHATAQVQVVLVKPERFENAAEIADHLREKRTVVLNLEQTQKDIARRLIDFLSGVAYAQEGKIKKVAISTYIITPYNVDIMGDLIDELESNGLYF